ncbi:MAG: hypothetical protein ACP5T9_03090 [Thermoplasmata archaeon]
MPFEEMYMAVLKIKGKKSLEKTYMNEFKKRFGFENIYSAGAECMVFIDEISSFDIDQITEWLDDSKEIEDYSIALGKPIIKLVKGAIKNDQ